MILETTKRLTEIPGIPWNLWKRRRIARGKNKTEKTREGRRGPVLRVSRALRVSGSPGPVVSQQSTLTHTHTAYIYTIHLKGK